MIHDEKVQAETQNNVETIGFHPSVLEWFHDWCHASRFKESELIQASYDALRNRHQEAQILGINKDAGGTQFTVLELAIMSNPGVEVCYMCKDNRFVILGFQLAGRSQTSDEDRIGLYCRGLHGEPLFSSLTSDCQTYDENGKPQLTQAMKQQLLLFLLAKDKTIQMADDLMFNYLGQVDRLSDDVTKFSEIYTLIELGESVYVFDSDGLHL